MFYSYKLIENAGFKSAEEFVEYYFKRHKNCCFKHTPKGIFLDYDFDTDKIAYFGEGACPICGENISFHLEGNFGGTLGVFECKNCGYRDASTTNASYATNEEWDEFEEATQNIMW